MSLNLRLYINPNYLYSDGTKKEAFIIYLPDSSVYITKNNAIFQILERPNGDVIIDETTIDRYIESRDFVKLLEFDKINIKWINKNFISNIKQMIKNIKEDLKYKNLYKIWVYLSLLELKL